MNDNAHDPFDEPDAEDETDRDWTPGPAPSMAGGPAERGERSGFERTESAQPGFDEYEWDSVWASIADDAGDDPDAALSQYAELVERMLTASGYALDDPVARAGEELEIVGAYLAARETAERAELGDASRGDVEVAIEDLRSIFDALSRELHS